MKILDIQPYDNFDVRFRLIICKTQKEMIRAYKKFRPKDNDPMIKTDAVFSTMDYLTHDSLPGDFKSNIFGVMHLNLETLSDSIIIHECAHAAFSFERNIRRYTGNYDKNKNSEFYPNGGGDEEEVFCYFLENAFEKVRRAIKGVRA